MVRKMFNLLYFKPHKLRPFDSITVTVLFQMNFLLQNLAIPPYLKLIHLIKESLRFFYGFKNVLENLIPLDTTWYASH